MFFRFLLVGDDFSGIRTDFDHRLKKASILFYDFACWPKDELSEVLKCETPAKGEVDFNRAVKWACSLEPICQSNYNFWDYYNFFGISLGKFFIHIFTSLLPALVLLCVFMKSKKEVYSAPSNSRDIQISINHNWFHSHSTSLTRTVISTLWSAKSVVFRWCSSSSELDVNWFSMDERFFRFLTRHFLLPLSGCYFVFLITQLGSSKTFILTTHSTMMSHEMLPRCADRCSAVWMKKL